jgi:hypothetical protein
MTAKVEKLQCGADIFEQSAMETIAISGNVSKRE